MRLIVSTTNKICKRGKIKENGIIDKHYVPIN
jgi:hypothetical protein